MLRRDSSVLLLLSDAQRWKHSKTHRDDHKQFPRLAAWQRISLLFGLKVCFVRQRPTSTQAKVLNLIEYCCMLRAASYVVSHATNYNILVPHVTH